MIKLLLRCWLFSSHLVDGRFRAHSACHKIWFLLKKRYRGLKMKYRTLKLLRKKRSVRKNQTTEKAVQALIIILALVLFLAFLLLLKSFKVRYFIFNPRYFFFNQDHILRKRKRPAKCPTAQRNENSKKCSNNFIMHINYNSLCLGLLALP